VIAANVDLVVNVVSLKSPPLRPGLIDRYLIATAASGAAPLVCVNKIDLLADPAELEPPRL
jgi:ribosome biogenesis GTPase / thiamine phosphate phosphatase